MKNLFSIVFLAEGKTANRFAANGLWVFLALTMLFTTASAYQASAMQQLTVTGQVIDAVSNESLPGVSIVLKGTTIGASTDINGNYRLQVPGANAVLVFSFIGYQTQEIAVEGRSVINVALMPSIDLLDEIIVVAYGTVARSNLTGSAVAITGDDLKDVFAPRVSTLLQSKVAGVYARSGSGRPGSTAAINIRGKGSINTTNAPLWVVDGIALGHGEPNINPADIESITVLKDASATALYGSRAANGVILITTKTPQKGVSRLNVNAHRGFTTLSQGNFSLMNSQQLYDYHSLWNSSNWFNSDLLQNNTDWIDIATQVGVAQEYNLSYNGGTEKVSAYVSGSYYNESGAIRGYDYERYSAIVNLNVQATDRITLRANLSGNMTNTDNREHSLYNAYTYLPWDKPYKEDGSIILPEVDTEYNWLGRDQSNYLYNLQWNYGLGRSNIFRLNVGGDYKITDWLTFSSMNNVNLGFGGGEWYTDPRSTGGWATNGSLYGSSSFSRDRFTNQMLRFNNNFGAHAINAFVAWEFADTHYEDISATGDGITAGLSVLNTTASASSVGGYKLQTARQKFLFNTQYVFDNKYMATLSFNREGSSSFGDENKYGNFWSFSGGWNMHYEDFMANLGWLNVLKLTASYGQVGNSPSAFPALGYYELTGQYAGNPAARPYQPANPFVRWERTTTMNFAVETRVFNRLSANIDLYQRNNAGLLYYVPLSSMTGYTGIWENIGQINNKGLELALIPEIVKTRDFEWTMNINVAFNRNNVVELYDGQAISSGNIRIEEGRDLDSYYMRIWHGVNPGNGDPLWERLVNNSDGDQTLDITNTYAQASMQFAGLTSSPDFTGGLINNISYKSFTLNASIGFVQGVYLYHSDRQLFDSDGNYPTFNHMNLANGWLRWEKPGDIATHPKPILGGNRDANRPSTRFLENASYLRLRNVSLSYQLPANMLQAAGFKNTRVFVSADNLLTFTQWSGMDPETGAMYPLAKKFLVGLNIEF